MITGVAEVFGCISSDTTVCRVTCSPLILIASDSSHPQSRRSCLPLRYAVACRQDMQEEECDQEQRR